MDKKQRNILVWVLIWAGLLVAVLYSPVGSPELYAPVHYYSSNAGVMYNNIEISNVPNIKSNVDNSYSGFAGQSHSSGMSSGSLSAVSGNTFDSRQNVGYVSWSNNSRGVQSKQNNIGGGSMLGISPMRKSQGSTNNTFAQNTGVVSMTTDMDVSGDFSTTKQSVGTGVGDGATDPGDDPTGPPIPLGDGWIFLLVLVSVYSIWKKIRI